MKKIIIVFVLPLFAALLGPPLVGVADDANEKPAALPAVTGGITQVASEPAADSRTSDAPAAGKAAGVTTGSGSGDPAKYSADAKWEIAGYNNEEIIYTIMVTNQDTRIIHCNALLKGFYFENGEKHSISDRQGSTIFPGRQVAVGHWMGMDQKSGATYELKCRAI
jgi:hypothetical protein